MPAPHPDPQRSSRHPKHTAYTSEAAGLLIISIVILIVILIRYWGQAAWGAH